MQQRRFFFLTFFLCGIRSPERFFPNQCKIIQELTDKSSNLLYCTFLRSLSYLTHKLLELPLLSKICLLFLTHLSLACLQQRKTFTEFEFWQRVQGLILKTCEGRLGLSTLTMLKVEAIYLMAYKTKIQVRQCIYMLSYKLCQLNEHHPGAVPYAGQISLNSSSQL